MWRIRRPRTQDERLWQYIAGLRSGSSADPDAEMEALKPVARLVQDALIEGTPGPSHRSEARLRRAIARDSESRRKVPVRTWVMIGAAATGWGTATVLACMLAYESGVNRGFDLGPRKLAIMPAPIPPVPIPSPTPGAVKRAPRHVSTRDRQPAPASESRVVVAAAPAVRVDEIGPLTDDPVIPSLLSKLDEPDTRQDDLMREANTQLAKGEWTKAATTLEHAADERPDDESALDALHLSGNIVSSCLNDSPKAGVIFRREAELARRLIERRRGSRDDLVPAQLRLARAMTSEGLVERDPSIIRRATREAVTSPETPPAHG